MTVETVSSRKTNGVVVAIGIASIVALGVSVFSIVTTFHNRALPKIHALDNQLSQMAARNADHFNELQKHVEEAQKNTPMTGHKILAEVGFLATVAQTQLAVDHDLQGALMTLQLAQTIVAASNDARFMGLSAAIQNDRQNLSTLPKVNTGELFTTLATTIQKVMQLSTLPQAPVLDETPAAGSADQAKTWHDRWKNVGTTLKKLVVIRHVDAATPPLMAPNVEPFLKQNIMTQLTMAQWALLHHDASVYQTALESAKDWMSHYFGPSPEKEAIMAQLVQLESMQIAPVYPVLANTQKALGEVNLSVPEVPAANTPPTLSPAIAVPAKQPVPAPSPSSKTSVGPTGVEA